MLTVPIIGETRPGREDVPSTCGIDGIRWGIHGPVQQALRNVRNSGETARIQVQLDSFQLGLSDRRWSVCRTLQYDLSELLESYG